MEQLPALILAAVILAALALLTYGLRGYYRHRQLTRTRAAGNAPPYITGERGYRLHQPDPDHLREPEYHQGDGIVTSAGGIDPHSITADHEWPGDWPGTHSESWDQPPNPHVGDRWKRPGGSWFEWTERGTWKPIAHRTGDGTFTPDTDPPTARPVHDWQGGNNDEAPGYPYSPNRD